MFNSRVIRALLRHVHVGDGAVGGLNVGLFDRQLAAGVVQAGLVGANRGAVLRQLRNRRVDVGQRRRGRAVEDDAWRPQPWRRPSRRPC